MAASELGALLIYITVPDSGDTLVEGLLPDMPFLGHHVNTGDGILSPQSLKITYVIYIVLFSSPNI